MRITVHLPNLFEGAETEVPGLGLFKNGTSTDVDDAKVRQAVEAGFLPETVLTVPELVFGNVNAVLVPIEQPPDAPLPPVDAPQDPQITTQE